MFVRKCIFLQFFFGRSFWFLVGIDCFESNTVHQMDFTLGGAFLEEGSVVVSPLCSNYNQYQRTKYHGTNWELLLENINPSQPTNWPTYFVYTL
jgi:hypothetical protein